MKEMTIQKTLELYPIYDAARVRVQSHVSYAEEESGMHASGDIIVKGQYQSDDGWHVLNEPIGLDITVQREKLLADERFEVKLLESRYDIVDQYLQIETVMRIYGVREEEEETVNPVVEADVMEDDEQADEPIERQAEEPLPVPEQEREIEPTITEEAKILPASDDVMAEDDWEAEDLWDDMQMKKEKYRLVWLSRPTTYEALAAEYEVDEEALQTVNRNKALAANTVVFLPMKEKDS